MRNVDKTTKFLLVVIALLLCVIALRSSFDMAQSAQAQIGSTPRATTSTTGNVVGVSFQTQLVNRISFTNTVNGVDVLPTDNLFLVRTANSVEVYQVTKIPVVK